MSESAYAAPGKLEEIVGLLANNPGSHLLAGGQSLLVEPRRSQIAGSLLVDLRKVAGLSGIQSLGGGELRIGAMTTLGAIADSDLIRKACPVLADAAALVGDAQVRNRATIGGALGEADPGSDLAPVLLVLGSVFEITGRGGSRSIQAAEFFTATRADSVVRRRSNYRNNHSFRRAFNRRSLRENEGSGHALRLMWSRRQRDAFGARPGRAMSCRRDRLHRVSSAAAGRREGADWRPARSGA